MNSLIFSKNKLFFGFLVVGYIFGVFLYDALNLTFVDELMAFFLVLFLGLAYIERREYYLIKHLWILGGYFLFQIAYSFAIHSNVPQAILMDAVIQIKPFLGFYGAFILMPELDRGQKRILTLLSIVGAATLMIVGITNTQFEFFGHPSRFATAAAITAILFLYCSAFTWKDIAAFIFILSIGLLSTRSKFYGFMVLALSLTVAVKLGFRFRVNMTSSVIVCLTLGIVLWVAWGKIQLYFFEGVFRSNEMWARPALYVTSFSILTDYIPFGSGLGSFATFASSAYYSDTYAQYGIDKLWGLSKSYPAFIADTYYPALAEVGFCGIVLFLLFWTKITHMAQSFFFKDSLCIKEFTLFVMILLFFAIESTSDSTFTHNRGLFLMILLGLVTANLKQASENPENETQHITQPKHQP